MPASDVHGGRGALPATPGGADDRTAVIIQPATPSAVAPLVTLADGLSERESQVTRLCMQGPSTRQLANA
jgi:ATP/maltotriose-dependent transcriptional regulator MalT